jgi:predicted transcriptional regulator
MEVHFTPEQEAHLAQIANTTGTDAERLVKEAALRLLQEDGRFRAAVREGVAQADRGEFIEEEEMDTRLAQMVDQITPENRYAEIPLSALNPID